MKSGTEKPKTLHELVRKLTNWKRLIVHIVFGVCSIIAFCMFLGSTGVGIAADSWTLWMKTEMFTLDSAEKKTPLDTFWNPAGKSKESSSFSTKAQCESQRKSTIEKFRALQGTKDVADGKRIIRVQGEMIFLIAQHKDGKGDSEQHIELLCRNDDPLKRRP